MEKGTELTIIVGRLSQTGSIDGKSIIKMMIDRKIGPKPKKPMTL